MTTSLEQSAATSHARYVVLALLCLAATVAYIGRNIMGVAAAAGDVGPATELGLSIREVGWVLAAFYWGYALTQIPCGWLGHVGGVRRVLTTYAIVWSIACAGLGFASGLWSLILLQALFGMAQAGIFPCSAAAITRWLPLSRRAFASGSLGGFMSIGGAMGAALTGFALNWISWRWVFVVFALPGVLWAIGFYFWFRNRPEEHSGVSPSELEVIRGEESVKAKPPAEPSAVPWGLVITSFDMWMIWAQQFFRGAGYIFFATWFPTYMVQVHGVSTAQSGIFTALPLMAVVAGCLVGGLVIDFIWKRTGSLRLSRQAVAVAAMLLCAVFIGSAFFVQQPETAVLLISLGTFSSSLGGPCGYTVTMDKAGQHVAPVFGAMNMCGNLGAAACPLVVSWLVERTGWEPVLFFFSGIYVSAAVCWALLNPNGSLDEPVASGQVVTTRS